MNVANRNLCAELEELSGWSDTVWFHFRDRLWTSHELRGKTMTEDNRAIPAYDLGYLLRKLPRHLELKKQMWHLLIMNGDVEETNWIADYVTVGRECWLHEGGKAKLTEADTPEDALCKLAIQLFKRGILKRGDDE